MRQHLDILANVLKVHEIDWNLLKTSFTTSADVVMEASGLRLEAIRVIAGEQGVEIEDTACRCIDESLLAALADAHVRRMKAYFNNARRHIAELDGDELATFINFCKTFNNRQSSDSTAQSWKDIDTDAIREQFIDKVHKLTPPCNSIFNELFGCYNFECEGILRSLSQEHQDNLETYKAKLRDSIIERIVNSRLYYEKPEKLRAYFPDIRSVVMRVTLSSRYHIYISEDEDHQQDVIINFYINHAPAMVA